MDYLTLPYFSTIIGGIAHQVGLHNYKMQFTITDNTDGDVAKNLSFKKNVKEKSLDGLIIIDQLVPDEDILWLKERGVPFVIVDRFIPQEKVNCVRVDNKKGTYLTTEHLIKQGHKRVAFVNENMKFNCIIDMFEGYCKALNEYGISIDKRLIADTRRGDIDSGVFTDLRNILRIDLPPTAILCSSDILAVKILRILKEMNIKVPQDIALAGYNDDTNSVYAEPQLTTVRVPLREMGEESARVLFNLIDGMVSEGTEVVLEPTLIERQSTASI